MAKNVVILAMEIYFPPTCIHQLFYITSHHNCPVLFMETSEIESNLLSIGEPKLHVTVCRSLCAVYVRILALFPDLEAARPRSTSGIQALCSLHIALEKTKNVLQHCADCSKLYLAITGDAVVMKFERTKRVLAAAKAAAINVDSGGPTMCGL
ncbi:U-box domain-containing protein 6 [Castilleja foliolosa]|uniref:U-box domain-containing protein 6 n=1 Tax=Castilleja foliolosa TaxID=1961234 RepID=A0ABD3DXC6_9LAMI